MSLSGESAWIHADGTLLDEMLRNVIENGIKYNRPNGEVRVEVERMDDAARVRVSDTGIMASPPSTATRSLSAFTAWTEAAPSRPAARGWACRLSKHGAEYITARIQLDSEVGPRNHGHHLPRRLPEIPCQKGKKSCF